MATNQTITQEGTYIQRQSVSKSRRGFASMSSERQREIARMGGRASGGNFAHNPQRAAEAGRLGGKHKSKTPR